MVLLSFIIIGVLILWSIYQDIKFEKREKTLLNRLMAKDYKEYNYFETGYRRDIAESEKIRAELRKKREQAGKYEEEAVSKKSSTSLSEFEEDWRDEEDLSVK